MATVATTQTELRLARILDERDLITQKHESLLASIEAREDKTLNEVESEHITMYRDRQIELDTEIGQLAEDVEATQNAIKRSQEIRRAMVGGGDGVEVEGEEVVYPDFATYARDYIMTRSSPICSQITQLAGGEQIMLRARERMQMLKRTPANTLSGDVAGLQPPQFIDQIFQVINKSRPLVDAAPSTSLVRGKLTFPKVAQRPVVSVQATEKTEGGNQSMHVTMEETSATTFLGGGDLSWQAINWSTPDALQLWFDLAAADYALKTEQDAAQSVLDDAFTNEIGTTLGATPSFADLMTAIGAGYSKVFAQSQRLADTVLLAPDRFGYLLGLTSTPQPIFVSVNGQNIGPLNILTSRGLDSGVVIVGDMKGLLVAETAGAPVELRVVEPAIGGLEVGLIGAFESVVVDPGAFSLITAAS